MNTTKNNNQIQFGKICAVANKLRKEKGITQKAAFALAKEMLAKEDTVNVASTSGMTKEEFINLLKKGSVKFTYKNSRGVLNTTKGTLNPQMITTTRKIAGAQTPKNPAGIVFYDRIHGVYRTLLIENLVKVF